MQANAAGSALTKQAQPLELLRTRVKGEADKALAEMIGPQRALQVGPLDTSRISDQAIEEMGEAQAKGTSFKDRVVSALQEMFDEKVKENPEAASQGKPRAKTEKTMEFTPTTFRGEVMPGRDVIGHAEIKEKKVEEPGQARATAGPKAKQPGSPAVPPIGEGKAGNKSGHKSDDQDKDRVELSAESAQMAARMRNSGAEVPQALESGKGGTPEVKGPEQGGEKTIFSGAVRTRATGWTQSVDVHPGGQVQKGQPLRTFQKLDNLPMLDHATLHRGEGKANAKEQEKAAREGKGGGDATTVEALRNPVAN
ncbi:MAG: hypothetical protein KC910_24485 [Candidatus Eremiobacteraeota bacterium]|nr:hypothetical protein [Candidatus Eremiobacteraeota bacterium]